MPDAFDQRYSPAVLIELGKKYLTVAGDKRTRAAVLKAQKTVDPTFRMPGDIEMNDIRAELAAKEQEREFKAAQAATLSRIEAQKAKLAEKYSADQIAEIETKVMQKYGISDYEAGAKLYAADFAPARPSGADIIGHGATWTFPQLPGLMEDPVRAAREAAVGVIDEINRGRH
jgi:hypothetical protein